MFEAERAEADFPPAHMEIPEPRPVVPVYEDDMVRLYHDDCLRTMASLGSRGERFTAIVTDPPYCSGGMTVASRNKSTASKYTNASSAARRGLPDFAGDNLCQVDYMDWITHVFRACHDIAERDAVLMSFIDWRQLQVVLSAAAFASWNARCVFVWDKTSASRPNRGWFRNQVEFVVCAIKGNFASVSRPVFLEGVWRGHRSNNDYKHITAKPVELMAYLMRMLPDGAKVLDPFAGSGSTLVAARKMGLRSVGIEYTAEYATVCADRLREKGLPYGGGAMDFEGGGGEDIPQVCGVQEAGCGRG
jgi:site-specific DNA-methyltransferase (adenine-specific)